MNGHRVGQDVRLHGQVFRIVHVGSMSTDAKFFGVYLVTVSNSTGQLFRVRGKGGKIAWNARMIPYMDSVK